MKILKRILIIFFIIILGLLASYLIYTGKASTALNDTIMEVVK